MAGSCLNLDNPIEDAISKIRFAPDSNNLLISSWDSNLRLYDVDGSEMRFEAHSEGALLDCCFQDEFTAFSASSDGCVRRYDLTSNTQTIVGKHDDSVIHVEYSKQTASWWNLMSVSEAFGFHPIDTSSHPSAYPLAHHKKRSIHQARGQVITAGLDRRLMFWDIQIKNGDVGRTKIADSEVWSLSVSGLHLLAAIGTKIDIYDLRNLSLPVQTKDLSTKYQIQCICSFSNCQGYAVGSTDGCVDMMYLDSAKDSEMRYAFWCHPKSKDRSSHLVAVNDIKFHPFNGTFVTGDNEGHAIMWNAETRKRLLELGRYPNSVASLSFNQGGQLLAVASSHTYQEAIEIEEVPQIFIHKLST